MHSENQNSQSVVYQMLIIGASDDAVFAKDTETDDLFRIDKHELMVTRIAELPVDELSILIAGGLRIHGNQAYEQWQEFWQQFREIRVTVFNNKLLYFDATYTNETPNTQESQPSVQRSRHIMSFVSAPLLEPASDQPSEYEFSADGIHWSDTPPDAPCENIWARPKSDGLWSNHHSEDTPVYDTTTPQHHLELNETTLKSTGKSVDIDAVIAKIDALTADK